MYHHPGEYVTDFCIVRRGDLFHLFHIRGERWTWPFGYREIDLGHAVSKDLRVWHPLQPVVPVGAPGAWDESGIWAPDIIEVDGVYYLYYTGSDVHNNQAIGLATSTDLLTWTKHAANPVVSPGDWSDRAVGHDVAGRDAMVFTDRGRDRYLMYYTATMADGRACLALAQSVDLVHWEDLGPTYIEDDRSYNRLESAYLVMHDGCYYLFYSAKGGPKSKGFSPQAFAHFDIVYLVSDDPTTGWTKLDNHQLLTEWTCASEHPTFDDITYMFCIVQEEIDGIWGASVLSDPKRIEWMADGSVRVREHVPVNIERRLLFSPSEDGYRAWIGHGGEWRQDGDLLMAPAPMGDSYFLDTQWGQDLALEASILSPAGGVASLLVRNNPSVLAGYRVSLNVRRQIVGFYLRFPDRPDRVIQERPLVLQPDQWHKLKVVAQGKFFDIYVDDALAIVHDERTYESGCFGLHAYGQVQFRDVLAYQYVGPPESKPDWYSRCRPRHLFVD